MSALVFWPYILGFGFLAAGLWMYRSELFAADAGGRSRVLALAPVFIAAALATFAGEHFTEARDIAQLVPQWLPLRLLIAYFVGVCLIAAALSFVAGRAMRWSAPLLALMFALFVVLMDLPAAIRNPGTHAVWIFPFREGSYALGGLSLFVYERQRSHPRDWGGYRAAARLWTAGVAIFYGVLNILFPRFTPGVPDVQPTSAWVPAPVLIAYLTGAILLVLGVTMLFKKAAVGAITGVGILMTVLSIALFGPDLFLAHGISQRINAINFVMDTLLFAGTMFAIARAIRVSAGKPVATVQAASS